VGIATDVFIGTVSNTMDMAQAIIVPVDTITCSSIHLVSHDLAKQLNKDIPKGVAFTNTYKKAGKIKDLISKSGARFVLILLPTVYPIPPVEADFAKGTPNDAIEDSFRAMCDTSFAQMKVMTKLDSGVEPFSDAIGKQLS